MYVSVLNLKIFIRLFIRPISLSTNVDMCGQADKLHATWSLSRNMPTSRFSPTLWWCFLVHSYVHMYNVEMGPRHKLIRTIFL